MSLQPNSLFANRYQLIRKLGTGGFSEVWLAEDTKSGNIQVALKIFATNNGLDSEGLAEFSREFSMVFNLNHPHLLIPKHYEEWNDMPFLVLQYMAKGSAAKVCGKINESELSKFLVHIGSALQYLHQQQPPIVHLDIKPDNILIDSSGNYVLTDFGISTKIRRTLTKSMGNQTNSAGTTAYMAPERFSKNLTDKKPIKANDIFSLGVTIFELLTDELPYGDLGGMVAINNIPPSDLPDTFNPVLRNVVGLCLAKEPWNRPTAEEIVVSANTFQKKGIWQLSERLSSGEPEYVETFKSVKIGNQIWMAENLNVERFRNGDPIPQAKTDKEWKMAGKNKQPAWCYYDNNSKNGKIYGKLYNWYAVNDPRGLEPEGWQLPSKRDFETLLRNAGGSGTNAYHALKSGGSSGFNALFGGWRNRNGSFNDIGLTGNWWSSSEDDTNRAWSLSMNSYNQNAYMYYYYKEWSFSVRCIKD